jgi:predicted RNA-binding protein with TRAM domain
MHYFVPFRHTTRILFSLYLLYFGRRRIDWPIQVSRDSWYGRSRGRSYGADGSKGFNRGSPSTKPVEVGGTYEVNIPEISSKGDGIVRIRGFIIFVKNGKVQNKIKVKDTDVRDRFAKASIEV